jgi:hypothetical protein
VRVLLTVAVFLLCGAASSQPPTPSPTELSETPKKDSKSNEQRAATDQRPAEKYSVTVNVLPTTNADNKSKPDSANHQQEPAHDWGLIIPTWILALATIGLFIYTARLWGATSRLVKDAKDTAKRQLRAYLWRNADVDRMTAQIVGFAPEYAIDDQIFNSGQTPAYGVHCWARMAPFDSDLPEGFEFEKAPRQIEGPRFVINPGSTHTHHVVTEQITTDDVDDVRQGAKRLYLWGEIRYEDAFQCPHNVWFRLFFRVYDNADGQTMGIWTYCDEGNDAN